MKDLKHFPRYRKDEYDRHQAARARYRGEATLKQRTLADGLEAEIEASRVKLCAGQIVFNGRADHNLTEVAPYPSVVSTSINPVVARMSAFRRAGINQTKGRPTVYILTLGCPLPALWGQTGYSREYELLLPPLLTSRIQSEYNGHNFDVIEALIVRPN